MKRGQFLILASHFPSTFRRQLVLGHGAIAAQEREIRGGEGPIAVELGGVGQIDRHMCGAGRGRAHDDYLATVGVGRQLMVGLDGAVPIINDIPNSSPNGFGDRAKMFPGGGAGNCTRDGTT